MSSLFCATSWVRPCGRRFVKRSRETLNSHFRTRMDARNTKVRCSRLYHRSPPREETTTDHTREGTAPEKARLIGPMSLMKRSVTGRLGVPAGVTADKLPDCHKSNCDPHNSYPNSEIPHDTFPQISLSIGSPELGRDQIIHNCRQCQIHDGNADDLGYTQFSPSRNQISPEPRFICRRVWENNITLTVINIAVPPLFSPSFRFIRQAPATHNEGD